MLSDVFQSCRGNKSLSFVFLALALLVVSAILLTAWLLTQVKYLDIATWTVLAIALFILIAVFVNNYYQVLKLRRQQNEQMDEVDPNSSIDNDRAIPPDKATLNMRRNALRTDDL
ncbi:unnamed protein product [Rodentolepis nana]|uniref:Transmembrane protein n=1 Tax=Rodentolepis nana TaxID=102285 RepID=A0A0R3TJT4_RODNA|nr:unnamed protein product [Rodentolepis nana]